MQKVFEVGSEYDWDSNKKYILSSGTESLLSSPYTTKKYLRSGRDALRYLARALGRDTVLMPALCCSCMPEPFEDEGYKIVYYKSKGDYSADIDDVLGKLEDKCVLLFMNYFSIPAFHCEDLIRIKHSAEDIITIEDITHELMNRTGDSLIADYTICSIRKWFAVPDGGVILSDHVLPYEKADDDRYFANLRVSAMKHKSEYLSNGDSAVKQLFRKELADANHYIDTAKNVGTINPITEDLINTFEFKAAYTDRLRNTKILWDKLHKTVGIKMLPRASVNSTLYFPIIVERADAFQSSLAQNGVYAPVIWPLPKVAVGVCSVADDTAEHMLAIPCDHRYTPNDMEKVAEIINRTAEEIGK